MFVTPLWKYVTHFVPLGRRASKLDAVMRSASRLRPTVCTHIGRFGSRESSQMPTGKSRIDANEKTRNSLLNNTLRYYWTFRGEFTFLRELRCQTGRLRGLAKLFAPRLGGECPNRSKVVREKPTIYMFLRRQVHYTSRASELSVACHCEGGPQDRGQRPQPQGLPIRDHP